MQSGYQSLVKVKCVKLLALDICGTNQIFQLQPRRVGWGNQQQHYSIFATIVLLIDSHLPNRPPVKVRTGTLGIHPMI